MVVLYEIKEIEMNLYLWPAIENLNYQSVVNNY